MRRSAWWIVALLLIAGWAWLQRPRATPAGTPPPVAASRPDPTPPPGPTTAWADGLPREARATLQRIENGGPFAYRQDGAVFQNREHRLPPRPRGYYHEYTVRTPGSDDRGARRIISGGDPPLEYFYSDDHYRSFRRLPLRDDAQRQDAR